MQAVLLVHVTHRLSCADQIPPGPTKQVLGPGEAGGRPSGVLEASVWPASVHGGDQQRLWPRPHQGWGPQAGYPGPAGAGREVHSAWAERWSVLECLDLFISSSKNLDEVELAVQICETLPEGGNWDYNENERRMEFTLRYEEEGKIGAQILCVEIRGLGGVLGLTNCDDEDMKQKWTWEEYKPYWAWNKSMNMGVLKPKNEVLDRPCLKIFCWVEIVYRPILCPSPHGMELHIFRPLLWKLQVQSDQLLKVLTTDLKIKVEGILSWGNTLCDRHWNFSVWTIGSWKISI